MGSCFGSLFFLEVDNKGYHVHASVLFCMSNDRPVGYSDYSHKLSNCRFLEFAFVFCILLRLTVHATKIITVKGDILLSVIWAAITRGQLGDA